MGSLGMFGGLINYPYTNYSNTSICKTLNNYNLEQFNLKYTYYDVNSKEERLRKSLKTDNYGGEV